MAVTLFQCLQRILFDGLEGKSSVREVVLLVEHFVRSFVIQLLFEVPRKEVVRKVAIRRIRRRSSLVKCLREEVEM